MSELIELHAKSDHYSNNKQYIARITGRNSKYTFEREFIGRKSAGSRNGAREMPYAYAILNFEDEVVSRHKSAHAALRAWRRRGSRYGWAICPIEGGVILPRTPYTATYVQDLQYMVERDPNA